jgi:Ca-activated chloride channel family protein
MALPISLASPAMLAIALSGLAVAGLILVLRRPGLPGATLWLGGLGSLLLCLAAGGIIWQRPTVGEVAVMVDLSPSTRTAGYRNRAALDKRIASLLGNTPHRVYYFAQDIAQDAPAGDPLPDMPAERTIYHPPAGTSAVLLFSDGRFEIPASGSPTYIAPDPALDAPIDAAIASLEVRGRDVAVSVRNTGNPRRLILDGISGAAPATAPAGNFVLARSIDPHAAAVSARLAPGDPWPENDQLTAFAPPAGHSERWWVGATSPGEGWRTFAPGALPTDAAAYLAPSVIVLENVAAGDLSTLQQQRLRQYVRDLGGGLAILGGDRAFAAGSYAGSALEALSPLASTPPEPTTHWMLVADSSGSMAQAEGGASRWHYAADALVRLIPRLPPDDLLSVGNFSDRLTWWSAGKSVKQTAGLPLPPAGAGPHGPTNLDQVLKEIAESSEPALPKQLLLMTDADAQIDDPAGLALALKKKNIHLHLLAIGEGSGLPALRIIIGATGGTIVSQLDPQKWTDAIQKLMRAASPKLLGRGPLPIHFLGDLASLQPMTASPWNRTWLKSTATPLAEAAQESERVVAGARWNVGEGRVLALAFDPGVSLSEALAQLAGRPPRDPRYRVTWDTGTRLRVTVDAIDGTRYLNDEMIELDFSEEAESSTVAKSMALPQTGPGRYELSLAAPRRPAFAAVRVGGHTVDRIAVAGRYAPEFDAIGNDAEAMEKLAHRTGGQVIPFRQTWPIEFRWPQKPVPLTPVLAMIGAALIALALVRWKLAP